MSLEKYCGFSVDDAASLALDGYTITAGTGTAAVTGAAGPNGESALVWSAKLPVAIALNSHTTHTFGMHLQFSALPSSVPIYSLFELRTSGNVQIGITLETNGKLSFYRRNQASGGSAYLGQTTYRWTAGAWAHVQIKTVCAGGTSGSIEVRINGSATPDLLLTGINTNGYATSTAWDEVSLGYNTTYYNGINVSIANFWSCDGAGAAPYNGFLGEARADPLLGIGAGTNTGLTPSTGSNFSCVNETAPINASTYVSGTSGKDTYTFGSLGFTPATPLAFQIRVVARKTDAGARSLAGVVRYSGTDHSDTAQALQQTHTTHTFIHTAHPDGTTGAIAGMTGADFATMFAACEFGVEVS